MGSLRVKLTLAFLLVAVTAVGVVALFVGIATPREFSTYLTHTGAMGRAMERGQSADMEDMHRGMMGGSFFGFRQEPLTPEASFLKAMSIALVMGGLVGSGVALLLSFALVGPLVAPLRQLKAAARSVADGDLSQRVPVSSGDEVGDLAAAFNSMADALVRNEEARRNLVVDVAHELRTPLAVLQVNIEAMEDGLIPLTHEALSPLRQQVGLLSRLVTDLRTLSLADTKQLKVSIAPTAVAPLLEQAIAGFKSAAEEKGVHLELDMLSELPSAMADGERVAQILHNLLSNAVRYTPKGGAIILRAVPMSAGNVFLFSVSDTGPGIPQDVIPRLFERFYRADTSRSRATGGTGIGLAVVKELVEAQGGKVWAESTLSAGSTFYFTLPVAFSGQPE